MSRSRCACGRWVIEHEGENIVLLNEGVTVIVRADDEHEHRVVSRFRREGVEHAVASEYTERRFTARRGPVAPPPGFDRLTVPGHTVIVCCPCGRRRRLNTVPGSEAEEQTTPL